MLQTTDSVRHLAVHGTRGVREWRCVEERRVGIGHQRDRDGGGQESIRGLFVGDGDESRDHQTVALAVLVAVVK